MTNKQQAYVDKLQGRLDEFSAEVDKLTAKARQSEAQARIDLGERVELLKVRRDDLLHRMRAIKSASEDSWEDLREGAQDVFESFTEELVEAKERVETSVRGA